MSDLFHRRCDYCDKEVPKGHSCPQERLEENFKVVREQRDQLQARVKELEEKISEMKKEYHDMSELADGNSKRAEKADKERDEILQANASVRQHHIVLQSEKHLRFENAALRESLKVAMMALEFCVDHLESMSGYSLVYGAQGKMRTTLAAIKARHKEIGE